MYNYSRTQAPTSSRAAPVDGSTNLQVTDPYWTVMHDGVVIAGTTGCAERESTSREVSRDDFFGRHDVVPLPITQFSSRD